MLVRGSYKVAPEFAGLLVLEYLHLGTKYFLNLGWILGKILGVASFLGKLGKLL